MKNSLFQLRKFVINTLYQITKPFMKNGIAVLCYHSISESNERYAVDKKKFELEVKKIMKHSEIISIDQALRIKNPKKSYIVMTFDDGYKDLLTVLPIIKKYEIPATAFIMSDRKKANKKELNNSHPFLTTKELLYIHEQGIEIGCHSATHADLTKLSHEELQKEIITAKNNLEKELHFKINYFAYPKGKYNKQIINTVKKAGYIAAFSIDAGTITLKSDKWTLPRTIIDKTHQVSEFPAVYAASTFLLRNMTNKFNVWERFLSL